MPKVSNIQNSFNSGIFSKRMRGRTDFARYGNAAEEIENFLLAPQGGLMRRPGSVYSGEVQDSSKPARYVDFEFSVSDSYALVLNNGKIEFFRNRGRVLETAKNITGATKANPGVITAVAHGFSNTDRVFIQSVVGMTELNGKVFTVADVTTDTFTLKDRSGTAVNTTSFTTYTSGGTVSRIYSISHPWTDDELENLQWDQDADTLYIFSATKMVRKLARESNTNWSLTEASFAFGPFQKDNSTVSHTMAASATTGTITITSSTAFFNANMVGSLIKIGGTTGSPAQQGYAKITVFTNTTTVTATVSHTLSGTAATDNWAMGSFSVDAGFPRCGVFHESRLFMAGTTKQPRNIWGSVIEDFESMELGEEDDDALDIPVLVIRGTPIVWLASEDVLVGGSSDGVIKVSASGDAALTASNLSVKKQTSVGASVVKPEKIGSFVYYVQRDGKTLREFKFDFDSDRFIALNMSLFADEVTKAGIRRLAFQQAPDSILWCVTQTGRLASFTRERSEEVMGWSEQITGTVEDVIVIPQEEYDEVWLIVKRTINGTVRRYIEYLSAPTFDDQEDAFFVDSGLTYDGVAATVMTNLDHLEGEEVSILADGAVHPNKTVSGGNVTLNYSAEKVHIGLKFTSKVKTLRVDAGSAIGSAQGMTKRINKIIARLWESLGMKAGSVAVQDEVVFRKPTDPMDSPPPLFTGDKELQSPSGWDKDAQVVITQDQPLPLNISAVILQMTEVDR